MSGDRIDAQDLNRTLTVWRGTVVDDGQGGETETLAEAGTVRAKVDQPSEAERVEAMRAGVDLTSPVYFLPGSDVRRGDELRGGGEVFRVQSVVTPSTPVYLRAQCEREQVEDNE